MNRIGWAFLALFLLAAGLVALLVDFGSAPASRPRSPAEAPPPADPLPPGMLTLPVRGVGWSYIRDSYGEERAGGERRHTGVDIMAPAGIPVVAAAPGTVEKLFYSEGGGGVTAYVRSPDRRLSYYYAHLAAYAPTLREGARVRAGDPIGAVGDTGNAGAGNFHLHFGIERLNPDEPWYRGRAINPYPLLARGRSQR
ncbi:M23 family metallopeptidase [Sphingomonas sp. 2R-10]|uniref:murein hydrolase activator EnvC family protein n=1 Tax=Sphingomonas sp. 2R-10 TaxID=3045148 RepID=UPI000F78F2D7|nr:M23 family metallopeptidase [Sphingomonas sp. 2R-10]MDJ0277028.1 M23 family metallopeptidase [Sphingomonas sp. 2R-10]